MIILSILYSRLQDFSTAIILRYCPSEAALNSKLVWPYLSLMVSRYDLDHLILSQNVVLSRILNTPEYRKWVDSPLFLSTLTPFTPWKDVEGIPPRLDKVYNHYR